MIKRGQKSGYDSINTEITLRMGFPNWFLVWWEKMGLVLSIVPQTILNDFTTWYTFHPKLKGKTTENPPIGRNTLWFFTEFRLVWIWKWDLQIHTDQLKIPIIQRTFWCKWWDGFDEKKAVENIRNTTAKYVTAAEAERNSSTNELIQSSNLFSLLLDSVRDKYPHLSMSEQKVKVMESIKEQFLASQLHEPNKEEVLAGEAQDPFEDFDDEDMMSIASGKSSRGPSVEDYLDAIIEATATIAATATATTTATTSQNKDQKKQ
jgi:hypothetical protein